MVDDVLDYEILHHLGPENKVPNYLDSTVVEFGVDDLEILSEGKEFQEKVGVWVFVGKLSEETEVQVFDFQIQWALVARLVDGK